MPLIGEENKKFETSRGYEKHPLHQYASAWLNTVNNILDESQIDLCFEPIKAVQNRTSEETLKNFFIEESCDPQSLTPEELDDHYLMMEQQFDNDRQAILENTSLSNYNPVIGMTFPLHKNILMNCVFDKGAIPKVVAKSPKFTFTMENRYIVKPDGERIDIYKQQDQITSAIDSTAPFIDIELKLPETGQTDILEKIGASSLDNLSIETYISAVKMKTKTPFNKGDVLPDGTIAEKEESEVWFPVNLKFTPSYGEYNRIIMEPIVASNEHMDAAKNSDVISAVMKDNKFIISALKGNVSAVKLTAKKDTSNALLQTCSVMWNETTKIEEIGPAIPINTTLTPEEIKDVAALYNVNQLTKIMSTMQLILTNYKDDKIRQGLDDSFIKLEESQKDYGIFDFAPPAGYMNDYVSWREATFMDFLDSHVTNILQILNDPNVVVTVLGRPDLIRKITPTEYEYKSPSNIGPVELEFSRVIKTSDSRVYQFISSQKLKNSNELILILCPRNTNRIIYRIYDYQLYISNEIKNAANPTLPSIHAFERWKFVEYQPVQGRIGILNPVGYREGKDIPTLGTLGPIGMSHNIIPNYNKPTQPKAKGLNEK